MDKQSELVEIYRIHVEMIDRVSQRRGTMNQFYITVLIGLLGVLAIVTEKDIIDNKNLFFLLLGFVGILLCVLWYGKIISYKRLNSAKFQALSFVERQLAYPFYQEEWKVLSNDKKYKTLTSLEKISPILLSIPFWFLSLYGLLNLI